MRPIHAHEINHVTRAALLHRLAAALVAGFFLTLAWVPPAAGAWGILLPWASGGPAPHPVLLGSLAYAIGFAGWMTREGVAAALPASAGAVQGEGKLYTLSIS